MNFRMFQILLDIRIDFSISCNKFANFHLKFIDITPQTMNFAKEEKEHTANVWKMPSPKKYEQ